MSLAQKAAFFALIFAVAFSCGCAGQNDANITVLQVNGELYKFTPDLRESIEVSITDPYEIKDLFDRSYNVCVVFDHDAQEDMSYFAVVSYNMVFKIARYYAVAGKQLDFSSCSEIDTSSFDGPVVVLKGPVSGAVTNSVEKSGNAITVQGMTFRDLEKSGDRLILAVFGINDISQIEN